LKIAVVNSGSSSLKFKLFEAKEVRAHFVVENIGRADAKIIFALREEKIAISKIVANHYEALKEIVKLLKEYEILADFSHLDAIGHRVVHGGETFIDATVIDDEAIKKIESLKHLDPLHNGANLEGILLALKIAPLVKQIAVFDTAFHSKMPKEAYLYALEAKYYENYGIRRYGFHGSSHSYLAKACAKELQKDIRELNIITLHLGNGSSVCAVQGGVSIDTSMGFTPLEGVIMGTRCGDIDAGVVFYMQRELGLSVDETDEILNTRSGLFGLCGTNDIREISISGNANAKLALDMLSRSIKKYIGAYMALLGRVDAIVFGGGIGENSAILRKMIFENINFGILFDDNANEDSRKIISKADSKIDIMVIKTDEEQEIANECYKILES
jgi:acetate kinase